ncbi:hypothetical protein [Paraclostridium sordellii]|uniref:hypothetical protein n=1 Tax=Paraclostridium sordellii TaxID=1505 RepID=UPI0005E03A10|nr:hypothetical protein [Paeniclostridium sordellii]CEN87397.1 Uncharacterised protein [[Clostridium] sordellii] [Paeniclostridium sordellii]CEQ11617.1 Uncharacterised protein [[Clostridium] sordellii] [Paeniclostridium sordellii]
MSNKSNEILLRLILWKEVLYIPTYTILYNYFKKLFWIVVIIDRFINLLIIANNIDIDELFDKFLKPYEDKKSESLSKLGLFTIITTPILYILTFFNNKKLFLILIVLEVADFVVFKFLSKDIKK